MATLKNFAWLIAGVFFGAIVCAVLRVAQYKLNGLQPNMAPEMFIIFAPMLAFPIALIAFAVHFSVRASFVYRQNSHWFFAGSAYSSILLLLVTFWLLPIVVILWFLVVRTLRRTR